MDPKWLLNLLIFFPIAGMAGILAIPSKWPRADRAARGLAVLVTFIEMLLSFHLVAVFVPGAIGSDPNDISTWYDKATFFEVPWVPGFHINYRVGVDGLSVILIALTGFLSFLAAISAFTIKKQVKGFYALYLLLVTGMMGVFVSLDFFLFYVFWEIMLLPMYFLIGLWGGPRREYAAIKFFIYTLVGSVLILIVMLAFYFKMGELGKPELAFNIPALIKEQPFGALVDGKPTTMQLLLFFGLFIGFAIKVPIFPFHTWLPDAHVEAPTPISVILAGVLLKMGGYGFLRINWPLLPQVGDYLGYFMACLALVNIVYGGLCAMGQTDFKKLVAYSSVSHMGYVLLGIAVLNSEGVSGAIFQMFTHGTSSAMMFLLVGVLYERAHHREIARFGGIALRMPVYFALAMVGFFAALGLPGMSGFVSEILVFLGGFKGQRMVTMLATIGLVFTAGYILWAIQRVFLGKLKPEYENFPDCDKWELVTLVPLAAAAIVFGVLPKLAIDIFAPTTDLILKQVGK